MLAIAALSASLEAPRLKHESLAAATAEIADAPANIGRAIATAASRATESHLGFDTNVYPGDKAMSAWRRDGQYEWVGYYLQAPCHKDDSWSGKRQHLIDNGWGLAVIYVGQQTWGKRLTNVSNTTTHSARRSARSRKKRSTHTMRRSSRTPVAKASDRCSVNFVNAAQGKIDAAEAIADAQHQGFARGTVIFLDVEYMDVLPQSMRDYYRAWAKALLADGRYRPGIYAHTRNAESIYSDIRDVFDDAGVTSDPSFWIAGTSGFDVDKPPTDVGHQFADVWQGMLNVVRTHNGVLLPIDISVASVPSPSSPAAASE